MKKKIKVKTEDLSQEIYTHGVEQVKWKNLEKEDIVFKMGGMIIYRFDKKIITPFFDGPYRVISPDKKILQTVDRRYIRILSDTVLYRIY